MLNKTLHWHFPESQDVADMLLTLNAVSISGKSR